MTVMILTMGMIHDGDDPLVLLSSFSLFCPPRIKRYYFVQPKKEKNLIFAYICVNKSCFFSFIKMCFGDRGGNKGQEKDVDDVILLMMLSCWWCCFWSKSRWFVVVVVVVVDLDKRRRRWPAKPDSDTTRAGTDNEKPNPSDRVWFCNWMKLLTRVGFRISQSWAETDPISPWILGIFRAIFWFLFHLFFSDYFFFQMFVNGLFRLQMWRC